MKQRLLKTMLLVVGLLLGANVAWADVTPFTQNYEGDGVTADWTSGNTGRYTVSILGDTDHYLSIDAVGNGNNGTTINSSSINGKAAAGDDFTMLFDLKMAGGNQSVATLEGRHSIFTINDASGSALFKLSSASRAGSTSTWFVNDDVTTTYSMNHDEWYRFKLTRSGTTNYLTITRLSNSTEIKERGTITNLSTNGGLGTMVFATDRYYSAMAIDNMTVRAIQDGDLPAGTPTSYTIKLQDEAGASLGDDILTPSIVGEEATATAAQMASFIKEGKKYNYKEGNKVITLVEDASANVIILVFSEAAPIASLKVNYMLGETLVDSQDGAIANLFVGDEVAVPYRMYIQKNGKLYQAAAQTGTYYAKNTTLTENTVVEVAVSEVNLKGGQIALLADLDDTDAENAGVRASYCSAYNNTEFTSTEELPAGTYTFIVKALNKGRGSSIKIGETTVCSITDINETKGAWTDKTIENVVIPAAGNLSVVKGESSIDCYDVIIAIRQTANYTVKFMAGETELKDAVIVNGFVGEAIDVDALKERILKDGVIYAYVSDDAAEKTIATDGSTVVTLTFAEDTHYKTPLFTLKGTAGQEVSVGLGVYDAFDIYGVDFGDGVMKIDSVGWRNGPVRDPEGYDPTDPTAVPKSKEGTTHTYITKFTGTVAGDGTIKVYGKSDLWYLNATNGALPTDFEQPGLAKVVEMSLNGADIESIALPALEYLTSFTFNNTSVKTVDVSKATKLKSLSVSVTSMSNFDNNFESIDLSKNTELETLKIQGVAGKVGKMTSIDLTNNTKLTYMGLYLNYNSLTEVKLGENTLTTVNVANNQLTSFDLTKLPTLKDLYASDNKLTSLDFSGLQAGGTLNVFNNELTELNIPVKVATLDAKNNKLTKVTLTNVTSKCNLEGNQLTLATIPAQPEGLNTASKTKKFTYAPQAALQVADLFLVGDELDLSAQATVAKGELNPAAVGEAAAYTTWLENKATVFTVKTVGETPATLVEGTDYNIAGGKITFLKAQDAKVYVEMTNEALPKFTGANAFKTSEFTVVQDFFGEKLAAAMAAPVEKVATLTLDADYEVLFPVNVPLGTQLVIDGANHTLTLGAETNFVLNDNLTLKNTKVDATKLTKPLVALTAEPAEGTKKNQEVYAEAVGGTLDATDVYLLDALTLDNVMIKELKNSLVNNGSAKWSLENLTIKNSIIQLNVADGKTFIKMDGATGAVKNMTITGNTIYNLQENSSAYFVRFSNASNAAKIYGINKTAVEGKTLPELTWTMTNNTLVGTFTAKDFGNSIINNKQVINTVSKNVFYDVYRLYQFIQSNQISLTEDNIMWYVKTSPQTNDTGSRKDKQNHPFTTLSDPGFTAPTTALDLAAENGGIDLKLGASTLAAKWQAGDPRWAVTFAGYTVTAVNTEGLEIVPETTPAAVGEKVYASYTLTAGYDIEQPEFVDDNGDAIAFAEGQMGLEKVGDVEKMWFIMPAKNVTIKAHASKLYKINLNLSQEGGQATCLSVNKDDESTFNKKEGKVIYLAIEPATNYEAEISVMAGETKVDVVAETGTYSEQAYTHKFTMPAADVTVTVTFKQTTGIQSVKAADLNDAVIYNLNGARVSKAGKGLYIINGKKVVIK